MLKTFALIISINGQAYVQDSGMSGADCIAEASKAHGLYTYSERELRSAVGGVYSCVAEQPEAKVKAAKW